MRLVSGACVRKRRSCIPAQGSLSMDRGRRREEEDGTKGETARNAKSNPQTNRQAVLESDVLIHVRW